MSDEWMNDLMAGAIDYEVIQRLTEDEMDEILARFEKAGY